MASVPDWLVDRSRGVLLGTFVGDALGMPFEGAPAIAIPERLEMLDARLGRGTYTDDTQMTLALAESLLRRETVDEEDLAGAFRAAYEPDRGYGAGTREVFAMWSAGVPVAEAAGRLFDGQGSLGNGAAMRVAPVGVFFIDDEGMLDAQARRSARITHAHPIAVDGAAAQAAAVAASIRGDDPLAAARATVRTGELRDALQRAAHLGDESADPANVGAELGATSAAHESVPAAVLAASKASDFEAAVTFAIRCGGDTDTIGAMAGAVAGARFGAEAIPERWLDPLEDGERGRSHAEALAVKLAEHAAAPR